MDKELASADVAGKAEAARRWVNHVNADKTTGAPSWRYLLVGEADVAKAKGAWPALKSLNRI
jgi:type III restriction enzyme